MIIAMRILGALTTIYMVLTFLRVMLTWFDGASFGRPYELLASVTDPYLDWFHRFPALRGQSFDFTPVAALAVLALANNVFVTVGYFGHITVGIILSIIVSSAWSAVAFILIFFVIVLALRLVSYSAGRNSIMPFWHAIDAISGPVLYRINRWIFRDRLVSYRTGLITAIVALLVTRIAGGILTNIASSLLAKLPF